MAAPHAAATEAGRAAFESGGNAVDAALATNAVLTVAYPHMCGLGGDLFALIRSPDGAVRAINGSGAAPAALDAGAIGADVMPLYGPLSVTVPGAVAAWGTLAPMGRLGLPAALGPAIALARRGVPVSRSLADSIERHRSRLLEDAGAAALFVPNGTPLRRNDVLRHPSLADTLETIASDGPDALYHGPLGDSLAANLRRAGSPMTPDDLGAHRTELVAPLRGGFRGWEILTAPPNSQGFVLLRILAAVERLDLDPDPLGSDAATLARVFAAASAERDRFLADPRHAAASPEEMFGRDLPEGLAGTMPARSRRARPDGDTIALVAADEEGWAVSLIQSLFHSFGSGILDPATGIVCHNRGALFSLDPGSPNVLAGRKRPLHTLMPVLVERSGRIEAACGTMGGLAQPQIHAQVLLRILALGSDPARAVAAPRWVLGSPDVTGPRETVLLESRGRDELASSFRAAGFDVQMLAELDDRVGHAQSILIAEGGLEAGSDPRSDGAAAAG